MTVDATLLQPKRYHFSVDEFEDMAAHGILSAAVRLELIDGEIVHMSPIGWKHVRSVNNLTGLLTLALGRHAIISVQNPVVLSAEDEPQPDLAVLRLTAGRHRSNPQASDVWLIVEVADTTLLYDTRVKLPLSARGGIPEAWIVDVDGEKIFQYSTPGNDGYHAVETYHRGDTIVSHQLPDIRLIVDDILPPR